ncbi:MAG: DUF2470 domain-containing protein [Gammaproteobacteria bacterium]|nr:DUF2470 domain-containing protein [Gammaproteobacteria bacterium]
MSSAEQQAAGARQLLAGTLHGVLSTHSLEHPGFPFGSLVPYVIGNDGLPVMLLSHLSQHTKNVDVDPRCGLVVIESGSGDIQQLGRLSGIGELRAEGRCDDAERYFRYFPASRSYHEQLGFRFYRFRPQRFHWNGGFATARWFGNDRIVMPNPLTDDVQQRIVTHMNADHAAALAGYLEDVGEHGATPDATVEMVGIDAEGIDIRVADRIVRIALPEPINDADSAREALVRMAAR